MMSDSVVLSFDSVGHTIGSGRRERKTVALVVPLSVPSHLAADPGKDRAQKELKETMAAPVPAIPKYDKLGFLLNLDSKLPPELASKYANFSEGVCKPGYASSLMTVIFPKFSKPAPMFLDDSFRKWARIRDFVPPFGIKGQDNLIKAILSATKDYRLTPALDSLSCRRCIIVGNGGVLANKSLGLKIDDYDVVVRLNSAPVKGFEKDVGGKTTLRITYPEGAIQKMEQYEKDSLFVLAGFKWQDFKWLKYIVYKEKVVDDENAEKNWMLGRPQCETSFYSYSESTDNSFWVVFWPLLNSYRSSFIKSKFLQHVCESVMAGVSGILISLRCHLNWTYLDLLDWRFSTGYCDPSLVLSRSASDGFWKSVATRVPREPHEIRILNPYFIQEAAFSFIGLPFNNGLMGRGNIPTLGSVAITMALHNCDEVAVAGFGYDMNSPNAPLHYYENIKMSAIKESWTHNIQREKEFLRKLVKARVITDLTSGI
ncbi:CMP-N-acetylneuraminate-beta-1,4-galactoside alpha-2,3-sialyltransferase isoform X3 [Apteryx rowi]|uniref:CMP-N-acetylneuraminate-beta-1,4-galactoside alpha-2,3-sialyltransferase isoform X3 n=1 Tax=Apteryx rowi TaxID=308060 RepID=UPI000E1DF24A|nr:CMP-N-acetylneuraminate-beta-1,4-galactoside alpha-2,3-sialyltransferase isoform X3 [Apteryx rowi]XP_025942596.1 CMP-N-acetylneuraminate-beta-1,4-galactoside alpha-2,3-sialyltransferase isoform X3 [Apteryx rowi]